MAATASVIRVLQDCVKTLYMDLNTLYLTEPRVFELLTLPCGTASRPITIKWHLSVRRSNIR